MTSPKPPVITGVYIHIDSGEEYIVVQIYMLKFLKWFAFVAYKKLAPSGNTTYIRPAGNFRRRFRGV